MNEKILLILLQILTGFLIVNVLITLFITWYKKFRRKEKEKLQQVFARQIAQFLYPPEGTDPHFLTVQRALRQAGVREGKPKNVQYLIRLMIRTQRILGGENQQKLSVLYSQIPPYRASYNKLISKNWFHKARGIREIYEMNQKKYLKEIFLLRDHSNVYVRREAQIALVVFLRWDSIRYLPYHTKKISLWQQIKIVEKLHDLDKSPKVHLLRRCYDMPNPWARQLVIRLIKKYQIYSESGFVLNQLQDKNYDVRVAAIYCLLSLSVRDVQLQVQLQKSIEKIPSSLQRKQLAKYLMQRHEVLLPDEGKEPKVHLDSLVTARG